TAPGAPPGLFYPDVPFEYGNFIPAARRATSYLESRSASLALMSSSVSVSSHVCTNGQIGSQLMSDPSGRNEKVSRKAKQLKLHLPTWGGKRKHAGRKPNGVRALVSHRPRKALRQGWGVHVTLRVRAHVWNLRSRRCFSVIERAFVA